MDLFGDERGHISLLRKRAEDVLRGNPVDVKDLSSEDIQYLLHELQVHQAELTLQNEDLRATQVELELSRDQYSELYEFAPAGYCTVDRKGTILHANTTLASLLGVEPGSLVRERFSHFVVREDQDAFYLCCQRVHNRPLSQSSEIRLIKHDRWILPVRLECMVSHGDKEHVLLMVIDNTPQREMRHQLIEQREKERQRIARDLHDGPVQSLAAVSFALHGIILDEPGERLAQALKAIQATIREQIQVLRDYSVNLRPPMLVHLGLEKSIRSHADAFQEKYTGIDLHLEIQPTGTVLSEEISVALYRIYQEALLNIARHALPGTTRVTVRLVKSESHIELEIQDNGPGFDPPEQWLDLANGGHLGILGMREQAEIVGGQLKMESHAGSGTTVWLTVPLNHSGNGQHPA
jgi:PAS domain S-box-containing protein